MTDLLAKAFAALEQMEPETQDAIARALLGLTADADDEAEHLDAVLEGMAQAERGAFAEGEAHDIVARAFARQAR